jgi:NAD(P)-dependent dehydrogenase (short-subunit alcohol dehydrogenase family)
VRIGLEGKVAIVTGASSGIGPATVSAFAAAGSSVVLSGRDEARLADAAAPLAGERAAIVAGDITQEAVAERLVRTALERFGRVDAIVCSAGLFEPAPVEETAMESYRQYAVNVRAGFMLVRAALPHLRAGASIVFISSIAGHVAFPDSAAYCGTKGAVELMAKAMAVELAPREIRVNCVAPGNVRTPMNEHLRAVPGYEDACNARTPMDRFGEPREIADAIVFMCSDHASYVTGSSLLVDGGWTAQ